MKDHNQINALIEKGRLAEALTIIKDQIPNLQNEALHFLAKLNDLESNKMNQLLTDEKYGVEKAKISMSVIQLLNPNDDFKELNGLDGTRSKILRVLSQQIDFYKNTIQGFSYSKKILFYILAFIVIIGTTSIIFLQDLFPERFGQILMTLTVIAFISLIVGSLGFINSQIQLFNNQKSFIKVQDES